MDLDRELFQRAFSHLKASPHTEQEVLEMTERQEKPKKFVTRKLLVAALAVAMAFALALGANAATGGELFETIVVTVCGDGFERVETENGSILYRGEVDGQDVEMAVEPAEGEEGAFEYHGKIDGQDVYVTLPKDGDGSATAVE